MAEPAVHPAEAQGEAVSRETPCHAAHAGSVSLRQTADGQRRSGQRRTVHAAQRYQSGLVIALLAARPLRIRNFQAITIGELLRWDGRRYWLVFSTDATKMRRPIEEPLPDDLIPYLEAFLRTWRPVLLRQAKKYGGVHAPTPMGRQLWQTMCESHPAKPDQALHQERIRHRCLAPPVP